MTCRPGRSSAGRAVAVVACAALCACEGGPPPAEPPRVHGPLALRVVHPRDDAEIGAHGATWLAGSLGSGRATLTVNGRPARVRRNGSFLAWVTVAPGDAPAYRLVAVLGRDTVRRLVPVRLGGGGAALPATGRLVVDTGSLAPRERLRLRADERVRVSVRAPTNARVWLRTGGEHHPLSPGAPAEAGAAGGGRRARPDPERWQVDLPAARLTAGAVLVAVRGGDTVRLPLAPVEVADPGRPAWVVLGRAPESADREIVGRVDPDGEYRWFFLPGTRVRATGARGDRVRVRLDSGQEAWVNAGAASPAAAAPAVPVLRAGVPSLSFAPGYVELAIPLPAPPAFRVEQADGALSLTLHGVESRGQAPFAGSDGGYVRSVEATRELPDRVRYTLRLAGAPYGYRASWRDGAFVLRVRRPPPVRPGAPLRGLTIAVDPGHPPHGAVGPTGLRESDVTLQVARRLARLLERRGARVVLTRGDAGAVALEERAARALRAGAHALVSIHADALGSGQDPARVNGTATFYFHRQSAPLAATVQRRMVERMGRADRGVRPRNLAVARATWMPAVLCEGAMIVHPDEEAALRTPAFQEAYARGMAEGLEDYFRALGAGR